MFPNPKKIKVSYNAKCPCGSGKRYAKCCISKNFTWMVDAEGNFSKMTSLTPEMAKLLKSQIREFKKIFNREPNQGDPVFLANYLLSEEDFDDAFLDLLDKAGIDPALQYACKKTGLMVTEKNQALLSSVELKEWDQAIDEFYQNEKKSRIKRTKEDKIVDHLFMEFFRLPVVFGMILEKSSVTESTITKPQSFSASYILFCATKTMKTLKAIASSLNGHLGEDAMNLTRSIYENYLYAIFVIRDSEKLENLVFARAGLKLGTHVYASDKNGKMDWQEIIELSSGRKIKNKTSTSKMVKLSPFEEDILIHNPFFKFLCQYTHLDISTMPHYYNGERFVSTGRDLIFEAVFFTTYVSCLVLDAMVQLGEIDSLARKDIRSVLKRVGLVLRDTIGISNESNQFSDFLPLMKKRTTYFGKDWPAIKI